MTPTRHNFVTLEVKDYHYSLSPYFDSRARRNAVGWGTALQVGRSRVRFPMSLEFFIDIVLPAALWPLGSTQPLIEVSIRNTSWGVKAADDNLSTFLSGLSWNLGASTSWNPQGLSRLVIGLLCFTSILVKIGQKKKDNSQEYLWRNLTVIGLCNWVRLYPLSVTRWYQRKS
jgi:hypothetical protein